MLVLLFHILQLVPYIGYGLSHSVFPQSKVFCAKGAKILGACALLFEVWAHKHNIFILNYVKN